MQLSHTLTPPILPRTLHAMPTLTLKPTHKADTAYYDSPAK
jgi:hypothetical protein